MAELLIPVSTLVKEPLSTEERELMGVKDINYYDIPILPNKTPGVCSPQSAIDEALKILLDPKNHPVLIHCNKGKASRPTNSNYKKVLT